MINQEHQRVYNDTSEQEARIQENSPALGVPIVAKGLATPSQPSITTDVAVEKSRAGPTHTIDLKCSVVKVSTVLITTFYESDTKNIFQQSVILTVLNAYICFYANDDPNFIDNESNHFLFQKNPKYL